MCVVQTNAQLPAPPGGHKASTGIASTPSAHDSGAPSPWWVLAVVALELSCFLGVGWFLYGLPRWMELGPPEPTWVEIVVATKHVPKGTVLTDPGSVLKKQKVLAEF